MNVSARVLLVGPDADLAESAAATLESDRDGLSVTVSATASEGLERLRAGTFDCVVSEYALPGRDGVEFLEAVRDDYPDLPFVLVTHEGSEDVAAAAVSAGVTEYLPREDRTGRYVRLTEAVTAALEDARATDGTGRPLRRTEQLLRTVPSCVVELDDCGRFVYANRRAKEVLGLEQSEVTGRTYNDPEWEIRDLNGDPIPDDELPYRQVVDSGEPLHRYRHTIRWPDGAEKTLSVSGAPLFDGQGTVERVVFSLTDITDRIRRERELRRYQQIVEHVDDVATIIDPDGTITYVSPAVERVLGYDPDELVGQNGFAYQPPDTRAAVAEGIERVLSDPAEPHTVRTKFRRADGSWCWVESTLRNRVGDDIVDGVLVSSREVTERIDRERRLEERERQLSQLHEATRGLLSSESPREVAATASRTAVEILDFPLNGIHFYDEGAGGLRPVAVSDESQVLFDELPVIDEGIAWEAFRDGEERVYDDVADADEVYDEETPVRSEMSLPLGDRGVFLVSSTEEGAFTETDVEFARLLAANTEAALRRVDKERQLRTREAELEQQNERLEEFASIVSHDLRNPLNVARGRVDLLSEERDGEHLPHIERALDRMEELISDTLTLAREGDTVAETEPIRLTDLVGQCWRSVSTGAATIEVDDDLTVYGDRSRLQHVFENLFRNSVEHSSTSSRPGADDAIEHGGAGVTVRVGSLDGDGIYVEDTGPGIPEAKREAVFEPGHTTASGGTGFGLTIVRRIVEAHGWEVTVSTGTDGGARFELTGVELGDR
jgi:PAS domain S-box-containing protein